jgi:hypothetical protein
LPDAIEYLHHVPLILSLQVATAFRTNAIPFMKQEWKGLPKRGEGPWLAVMGMKAAPPMGIALFPLFVASQRRDQ